MGYAFISYSSAQQRQLNQVKEYLKANHISFWAAPDDIPIGSKYSEVIKRAIANASCVLFLLSERSQSSTYCKLEIALALKLEKPIIPIQLEDVILNDDFALYLSSSEFFPLPRKIMTAKANKLLNQLRLLCADPNQEPVDPSYKIGWFRKGTWMQIFGWIWMIGGYKPFSALAEMLFTVPPQYKGANDGFDWFNVLPIAKATFRSSILVTVLMMVGLLTVCYGFSLNRKRQGKERLFFQQFSLCQILLLISCACWGISFGLAVETADHIDDYCSYFWADASPYICIGAIILLLVTLVVWLCRRMIQKNQRQRDKKKR